MPFARLTINPQRVPDYSRFVDTPREHKDHCFQCTLPFCNDRSKECAFLLKPSGMHAVENERQELIAELKEEGVILGIRGNGFIEWADDEETPLERRRRLKREWMRLRRSNPEYRRNEQARANKK